MSSVSHGPACEDCVVCTECSRVAYCLSERSPHPCPHDGAWCEDCRLEQCSECIAEVEADMEYIGQALQASFNKVGDPFRRDGDDSDPLDADAETHRTFNKPWRDSHRKDAP